MIWMPVTAVLRQAANRRRGAIGSEDLNGRGGKEGRSTRTTNTAQIKMMMTDGIEFQLHELSDLNFSRTQWRLSYRKLLYPT